MDHLIAPFSMIEVARPQSAIVGESGRALIIQCEPRPPRYTILTEPTPAVRPWSRERSLCPIRSPLGFGEADRARPPAGPGRAADHAQAAAPAAGAGELTPLSRSRRRENLASIARSARSR